MDIEKLTKSQIVLLTLLVSFVTSIATGIVTVSLVQQAPPAVAQTVNRVIEHTIETIGTSTPQKSQSATTIVTQQKTVIVNESDLVAQAVKQANPSIVRIYESGDQTFLGLGLILDASGTVASDIGALGDRAEATITLNDGTVVREFVTSRDTASGLLYLTPASSTTGISWTPATLLKGNPQLGESVFTVSGQNAPQIGVGLVTLIEPGDETVPEIFETDIPGTSIMSGSALVDTNGAVLGISTGISRAISPSGFMPVANAKPSQ